MFDIFLQITSDTTQTQNVLDHLIGSWYVWGPIIAVLIFILKAGTDVRQWISFFKERKEESQLSKEQKRTEKNIINEIHDARKKINKQTGFSIFPFDLDIRWVKTDKSKVDLDKEQNKVIAILQSDDTSAESFARTAHLYSQKGLLPDVKKHLPPSAICSIDLIMAKKIINTQRPDAIQFFENEIFEKENKKEDIKTQCRALGTLDDRGEFTRSFLKEMYDIGNRLKTITPNKWITNELKECVEYFYRIGNRKTSEKLSREPVVGKYVRVGVALIAIDREKDNFKTLKQNPKKSPHVRYIKELIEKDIHSIWLFSNGEDNVKYTKWLLKYFLVFSQVVSAKPVEYSHPYSQQPSIIGHIELRRKPT